ncbi:peptidase dimerization domain-containing protein [Nonomuraea sp. NPDC049486]|uniref:M20 family metallopeptidase n=1 Tax=Nonomuraea sp. NPDC049486 TaxID=3155773 RepID=UPI003432E41C
MTRPDFESRTAEAWRHITDALAEELAVGMTGIPSPPGAERELATWAASRLRAEGIEAEVQHVQGDLANAVGRISTGRPGPELLLYSPIDTHLSGDPADDQPWAGAEESGEITPRAQVRDGYVIGLGANNPKGHAAAVLAAGIAIRRSGVSLPGTLRIGLGGGGMPTNAGDAPEPPPTRRIGHGAGCGYLLEQGGLPDAAIIAKSGDAVAWEEPGLTWFKISVRGRLSYAGLRGTGLHRNPILAAQPVIDALEGWFDSYAERNERGLVRPQGAVTAIRAGWPHKPAFVPAECHIYLDLRTSPGVSSAAAERQLRTGLEAVGRELAERGFGLGVERVLSIPGSRTDPGEDIIRRSIAAWELVSGRSHEPIRRTSGATDANILRAWGVPTARIGMPRAGEQSGVADDFARAMNVCGVTNIVRLARILVAVTLGGDQAAS